MVWLNIVGNLRMIAGVNYDLLFVFNMEKKHRSFNNNQLRLLQKTVSYTAKMTKQSCQFEGGGY